MSILRVSYARCLAIILIGYLTVPSFVFVYLQQSSLRAGLMAYSVFLALFYLIRKGRLSITPLQLCIGALIAFSIVLYRTDDLPRQIFSLVAIVFIFVSTNRFFDEIASCSAETLKSVISTVFYTLIVAALLGKHSLISIGHFDTYKSAFPFSEPSHLALTLGPFACAYMFYVRRTRRFLVPLAVCSLALWYPNLTMLAVALLLFVVFLPFWVLVAGAAAIAFGAAYIGEEGLQHLPQYDYVAGRIGHSDTTDNLTYLVYIEGFQQAAIALEDTNGLGIGFQRLGKERAGEAADHIERHFGVPVSRQDGSNLGFKLVGEFGYLGVFLCCSMFLISGFALFRLRQVHFSCAPAELNFDILLHSCIYMFLIEVAFRGLSYFNPMLFLYIYGIGTLSRHRRLHRSISRKQRRGKQANSLFTNSGIHAG
jgi:hypothetical protein